MKWHDKPSPKIGDTRTRSWFALLPVKIKGETRWLEWVTVVDTLVNDGETGDVPFNIWDVQFADRMTKECSK
jgi:hypothetical protein